MVYKWKNIGRYKQGRAVIQSERDGILNAFVCSFNLRMSALFFLVVFPVTANKAAMKSGSGN
jgi:hypothetical protein